MAIFDICPFLTAPGPFKYFSENGCLQKIKYISIMVWRVPHIQFLAKVSLNVLEPFGDLLELRMLQKQLRRCYHLCSSS